MREAKIQRILDYIPHFPNLPEYWGSYARGIGATVEELGEAMLRWNRQQGGREKST